MNTSKLPNLDELSQMAGKLFSDLKTSVNEIYGEYKKKHPDICEVSCPASEKVEKKKKKQAGVTDNEASKN